MSNIQYQVVREYRDYEDYQYKVLFVTQDESEADQYCEYLNLKQSYGELGELKVQDPVWVGGDWLDVTHEVVRVESVKQEYSLDELLELRKRQQEAADRLKAKKASEDLRVANGKVKIKKYPFAGEKHQQKSFTLYDTNAAEVQEFFMECLQGTPGDGISGE